MLALTIMEDRISTENDYNDDDDDDDDDDDTQT